MGSENIVGVPTLLCFCCVLIMSLLYVFCDVLLAWRLVVGFIPDSRIYWAEESKAFDTRHASCCDLISSVDAVPKHSNWLQYTLLMQIIYSMLRRALLSCRQEIDLTIESGIGWALPDVRDPL